MDELVFGVLAVAAPAIRDDLHLSLGQVGVLFGVPGVVATFIEPVLGLWGDSSVRRRIVLAGGIAFAVELAVIAGSGSFAVLLIAFIAFSPSSGAFVSLSQATLMDLEPHERERNMTRWVVSGSAANIVGPLIATAAIAIGLGWRPVFAAMSILALPVVVWSMRIPHPTPDRAPRFPELIRGAVRSIRRPGVVRWLAVLELQDFLGDVFLVYLALYLDDVSGARPATQGLAVVSWSASFLVGGAILARALTRTDGLTYLRVSSVAALMLFPIFLAVPFTWAKIVLVAALGFVTAGWYSVSKAKLYASMHGASGTAMALSGATGLVGQLQPLVVGFAAASLGLGRAMWILLIAPISMIVLLPRPDPNAGPGA